MDEIGYEFRGFHIPPHMLGALRRYVENRLEPGSFLTAVIQNDLSAAVSYADDFNLRNIPAYVGWLHNKAPATCWGSAAAMQQWLEGARERA